MQIFIRGANGTRILDVSPLDSIRSVKAKLVEHPLNEHRLIYGGKQLSDESTLVDCGVDHESTLHSAGGRLLGGKEKAIVKFCTRFGIVFNVIFIALSLTIIILGSAALARSINADTNASFRDVLSITPAAQVLLVIGVLALIASVAGAIGNYKKIVRVVQLYSVFIFILVMVELVLGIFLSTRNATLSSSGINQQMVDLVASTENPSSYQTYASFFQCCDWSPDSPWGLNGYTCRPAYLTYCQDATDQWIKTNVHPIATITIIVAVVQTVGVVGTCIALFGKAKKEREPDAFSY